MKKIALLVPMLQPYRLSFYSKLHNYSPNAQWMIYHGIKKAEDGRPAYSGKVDFNNTGIIETKFRVGPFTLLVHKGLLKEIRKFNPDLIIIQAITGNLSYRRVVNWASRNNKVIINWTCAWEPGFAKGLLLDFKNKLVSLFFKKGHAFLTYSTKAVKYVAERGVDESKIFVCYNGLEIDEVQKNEGNIRKQAESIRQELMLDGYRVFIYVGGLIPEKRVDLLLEAFSRLKKSYPMIKLLIVGDGPMKNELTARIREMNDKDIIYLGRIIDGVDPYFAAADCLVLPGVGGLALNQAMYWGKICIASEADGTEEDLVIDNQTGYRFRINSLESLTASMQKVIEMDRDSLESMGRKSRDIILKKSNVNNMVGVFMNTVAIFLPELRPEEKVNVTV